MIFCSVLNIKRHSGFEVMPKKLTEMRYSSAGYYSAENKRVFVFFRLSGIMFGKWRGEGGCSRQQKTTSPLTF